MPEILIIEDEPSIRKGYSNLFAKEGYAVRSAPNGEKGLAAFAEKRPDVVLLDIDLPGEDGISTCGKMRQIDELVPIVFNTAYDRDDFKERGLSIGGDDYILKTDPVAELLLRVRRAIQRYRVFMERRKSSDKIRLGKTTVDLCELKIDFEKSAKTETLTRTEADILRVLRDGCGKVVSNDNILDAVRGEGFVCDTSMIYVYMNRLRKKLGAASGSIVNHRGSGYSLVV